MSLSADGGRRCGKYLRKKSSATHFTIYYVVMPNGQLRQLEMCSERKGLTYPAFLAWIWAEMCNSVLSIWVA